MPRSPSRSSAPKLVMIAAATLPLTLACSPAQVKADPLATSPGNTPQPSAAAARPPAMAPILESRAQGQATLDQALAELWQLSVFFKFDSAILTTEAEGKLAVVAEVLVKHRELTVRIEGNCDERGSEQYNLALGQRRADASRKYLAALGVADGQISSISFGAEHPAASSHDEAAWAQNRRDDLNARH